MTSLHASRFTLHVFPSLWGRTGGVLTIELFLASGKGVLHQGANRHRTYTSWNWTDVGAKWCHFVKLHISIEAESALSGGIRHTGGTYVDDHCTWFYHVGSNEIWNANRSNDNIGLAAFLFEILGVGVANGDGGVSRNAFLHHELSHRFANDVASTQNDALLSRCLDFIAFQELEDAIRSGTDVARQTN